MLRKVLEYVSLIVIILTFTNISNAMIDKDSIVGAWPFDEGSGDTVKDISSNGHDGKIQGELKWVKGKFSTALLFDGVASNYVTVAHTEALKITKDITMVAWAYIDGKPQTSGIISKYKTAGSLRGYTIDIYGERLRVLLAWDGGVNPDPAEKTDITNWNPKTWYHLAGVYDGKSIKFYINGEIGAECEYNKGIFATTVPLEIGRNFADQPFKGIIDEVAIFNVALTEGDIKNIMTKGLSKALGISAVYSAGKLATVWGAIKEQY